MCGLSVLLHHGPSIFSTSVTAHEVENGSGPPVGSAHPADRRIAMQGLQIGVLCLLMAAGWRPALRYWPRRLTLRRS